VILRWEQGRPVVDALLSRGQLTRVRPLRNHTQYPTPEHPTAQVDDVEEAIPVARAMVDAAAKLLDQMPPY
jgi:hypothetical protein